MKGLCVMLAMAVASLCLVGCAGGGAGQAGELNVVRMTSGLKYEPAELTVKAGDTVHWRNTAIMHHTVTADPAIAKKAQDVSLPAGAAPFNSGNIDPGKGFDYTFSVPGTYRYFCIPHESLGMVGVVNVQPPDQPATAP